MSTVLEESTTPEEAASSVLQRRPDDTPTLPPTPFEWWKALPIIDANLSGSARAVASGLARKTYKSGVKKATLQELSEWSGCKSERTVQRALEKVLASGLLARKRTRDGYVYTWTTAAYGGAQCSSQEHTLTRTAVSANSNVVQGVPLPVELVEQRLVHHYLLKRKSKYGAPGTVPSSKKLALLTQAARETICADIVHATLLRAAHGVELGEALDETCQRALGYFFENPGDADWLLKHQHPLNAMPRDLPSIMAKLCRLKSYQPPPETGSKLDNVLFEVDKHKCACGEKATRFWYGTQDKPGKYTCSRRECHPFVGETHVETQLAEGKHGAVDVRDVQGDNQPTTAPMGVELVQTVFNPRPPLETEKMPPVPRPAGRTIAKRPEKETSPELGRVKRAFERYPALAAIGETTLDGLIDEFNPDTLVRLAPEMARQMPRNQTQNQTTAWIFKFALENAA